MAMRPKLRNAHLAAVDRSKVVDHLLNEAHAQRSEPPERSDPPSRCALRCAGPAKRRASETVGESEGQSPDRRE